MKKLSGAQSGAVNALLIPVVLLTLLFFTAAGFGTWAFMGRQDYKNNSDAKVADAVEAAKKVQQTKDAADFAEASKSPLKTFSGPDAYGSVKISYPKTWGAYAVSGQDTPLDTYFHADYVPAPQTGVTYNLRVKVVTQSYSSVLQQYTNMVSKGVAKAAPYSLPKVPSVTGTQITGNIFNSDKNQQGAMVILPLRDKTLQIWTESASFVPDFNTYILPNLTFSP